MKPCTDRYVNRIRQLVLEELRGQRVRVYFFGSRVKDMPTLGSDVDLANEGLGPENRRIIRQLREKLEESTIPYKVDVIDLDQLDDEFRRSVLATGILWKDWS